MVEKMITIKDDIPLYKREIQSFIQILMDDPNNNLILESKTNESSMRCISKRLLFYKKIFDENQDKNYFNTLIYSLLKCINLLFSDSWTLECFHMYNRMFVEHFIKMILKYSPTPWIAIETIISKLFSDNKLSKDVIQNLNYFKSIYKSQSGGIHGGKSIHQGIIFYYSEMKNINIIGNKEGTKIINDIITMLDKSIELIIHFRIDIISETFNGKMPELKFLIGEAKYKIYHNEIYI